MIAYNVHTPVIETRKTFDNCHVIPLWQNVWIILLKSQPVKGSTLTFGQHFKIF